MRLLYCNNNNKNSTQYKKDIKGFTIMIRQLFLLQFIEVVIIIVKLEMQIFSRSRTFVYIYIYKFFIYIKYILLHVPMITVFAL